MSSWEPDYLLLTAALQLHGAMKPCTFRTHDPDVDCMYTSDTYTLMAVAEQDVQVTYTLIVVAE